MKYDFDVVIIGAGPAGWSVALALKESGHNVLVVDQSSFPRDKVCGGFLGFENQSILQSWGIDQALHARGARLISSIRLASSDKNLFWKKSGGSNEFLGFGVSRHVLDDVFRQKAQDLGVVFQDTTLVSNTSRVDRAWNLELVSRSDHSHRNIVARRVIRACGAPKVTDPHPQDLIGAYAMFRNVSVPENEVGLYFSSGVHVGVNPFEDGLTNVCYVASRKTFDRCGRSMANVYDYLRSTNQNFRTIMSSAEKMTAWKAVTVPYRPPFRFVENGMFCVGDAAAVIHPIVGGGMTLAMAGGCLLGRALAQAPEQASDEAIAVVYERMFRKAFGLRLSASWYLGKMAHNKNIADFVVSTGSAGQRFLQSMFEFNHRSSTFSTGQTLWMSHRM